ncbi:acyltransferase [Jeotgalibacillus proteolyticus]|uniref:acyltransferase n=1 Tax=Jeotgalibacillus proteolyticus TaxID=2082395 RepID=UPI003CEC2EA0
MIVNRILSKYHKYFGNKNKYYYKYAIRDAREKGVKVGEGCRFFSTNFSSEPYLIEIGNNVTITVGVRFITHDGGMWTVRKMLDEYKYANIIGKITIGNNVFIGMDSIILPGVNIGENSIVAAGSVVTKSFAKNSIIGGNPAKKISDINSYIEKNNHLYINTLQMSEKDKNIFIKNNINKINFRDK